MKKIILILLLICLSLSSIYAEDETNTIIESNPITITCTETQLTMDLGSTIALPCTVENNINNKPIIYGSSNASIASVNEKGEIKANSSGEAEITISIDNDGIVVDAVVKVIVKPETYEIKFSQEELIIEKNSTFTLKYTTSNTLTNPDIIWNSSNPSIVRVENGVVTGLKKGEATITAKYGNASASIKIIVEVSLKEIYFNSDEIIVSVNKTTSIPDLIYVPYDATIKGNASYQIEDETIAIIEDNKIKGLLVGKTTLEVTIGGITSSIPLEVTYDKTESNAVLLEFQFISQDDHILNYEVKNYIGNDKVALLINGTEIIKALDEGDNIVVNLNIDSFELKNIESLTLVQSIAEKMTDSNIQFNIINKDEEFIFGYSFSKSVESSLNLLYKISKIDTYPFYNIASVNGNAYQINFDENIPAMTRFSIAKTQVETQGSSLVFFYPIKNELVENTSDKIVEADGIVSLEIHNSEYLITFNAIGINNQKQTVFIFLIILALLMGVGLWFYIKNMKKDK